MKLLLVLVLVPKLFGLWTMSVGPGTPTKASGFISMALGMAELSPCASIVPLPAIVRNVESLIPPVITSLPPPAMVMVWPPEKFKLPSIVVVAVVSFTVMSPPMLAASVGDDPILRVLGVENATEPKLRVPPVRAKVPEFGSVSVPEKVAFP